jgi:asparagine synthase (glutamine-hydrolysing)
MCGIAGFMGTSELELRHWKQICDDMAFALKERGPDQGDVWRDSDVPIAFAHRRLSIIDLSEAGKQPMSTPDGRFTVTLNGEIYNHSVLRNELQRHGHTFRGRSDTEVLLAAIAQWGLGIALQKAVGMFAFALWDRTTRTLNLVRDRLGEKPLYYGWQGNTFLFGSSLKALKQHPSFLGRLDLDALAQFLQHSYVPAPHSIYRGISKLQPGTVLSLRYGDRETRCSNYWSAHLIAQMGQRDTFEGNDLEAEEELDRLMHQSIAGQMMADVPIGALLSGGIDSSAVVALMQARSTRPINTFTVGFREPEFDEAAHAKAVAGRIGSKHHELYVTAAQALDVIPRLPDLYDEPFADASQVPTFLIAQLARSEVTVALSGDGGDELFGGYNRYLAANQILRRRDSIPHSVRKVVATALAFVQPRLWQTLHKMSLQRPAQFVEKAGKALDFLSAASPQTAYESVVSRWPDAINVVIGVEDTRKSLYRDREEQCFRDVEHLMMYLDLRTYLPDDVLVKIDRAAMGIGLETRVPFLDHRLVEFAWRLPLNLKLRHGKGKWILRKVLNRYIPGHLFERPKKGFSVPIDAWLRGPLRPWAERLLDKERLTRDGIVHPEPIRAKWHEHLSGKQNWQDQLWNVLMLQIWLERWGHSQT